MNQKQTDIPRNDLRDILRCYSIELIETTPLYLGMDNINIKILADNGKHYVLKVCSAPADIIQEQLKIMAQCGSADQQPIKTKLGLSIFTYKQQIGYLLPFVEGEDLLGVNLTLDELEKIAEFHHHFANKIANIAEKPTPNIWDLGHFYAHRERYEDFLPTEVELPSLTLRELDKIAVHNDFTRSNLLRKKDGELHLLDYGDVAYGYEITDLSVALAHFCVEDTPIDKILPHTAAFLKRRKTAPNLKMLYQFIRLRFIQAITLTLFEEAHLGVHPRAQYWLHFGETGLNKLKKIKQNDFSSYLMEEVYKVPIRKLDSCKE